MKKIIAVIAACLMLGAFTACANDEAEVADESIAVGEQTEVANPMREVEQSEVSEQLNFALGVPAEAENLHFYIIDDKIEQMNFTLDGMDFTARMKDCAAYEDISGLYYEWTSEEEGAVSYCDAQFKRYTSDEESVDLCLWYDVVPGMMYSVSTSGSDLDGFDITAVAEQVFEPMQTETE